MGGEGMQVSCSHFKGSKSWISILKKELMQQSLNNIQGQTIAVYLNWILSKKYRQMIHGIGPQNIVLFFRLVTLLKISASFLG